MRRPGPLFQDRPGSPPLFDENGVASVAGLQGYVQPGCCNCGTVQARIAEVHSMMDAEPSLDPADKACAVKILQYLDRMKYIWIAWTVLGFGCFLAFIAFISFAIDAFVGGMILVVAFVMGVTGGIHLCCIFYTRSQGVRLAEGRARQAQNAGGARPAGMVAVPPGVAVVQPNVAQMPPPGYQV
jgi:hypothetical protein